MVERDSPERVVLSVVFYLPFLFPVTVANAIVGILFSESFDKVRCVECLKVFCDGRS